MTELQRMIEDAFERRAELDPATAPIALREAVEEALGLLELGKARVAEPCAT
jgi:2,3,4,5-tetrahydropyridine-2-carboxylate N-succinyltransferase